MPNPISQNPLMGKGGAHRKTRKQRRASQRQALRNQVEDWSSNESDIAVEYEFTVQNLERFDDD